MSLSDVFHAPTRADALGELPADDLVLAAVLTVEQGRRPVFRRDEVARELAELIMASRCVRTASRIIDIAASAEIPWHVAQQYNVILHGGYRPLAESFDALADDELFHTIIGQAATWSLTKTYRPKERSETAFIIAALPYISSIAVLERAVTFGAYPLTGPALCRLIDVTTPDHAAALMDGGLLITDSGFLEAARKLPVEYQLRWALQGDRCFIHRRHLQQGLSTEVLQEHLPLVEDHVRAEIEKLITERSN
jgi:hypothetical protein